MYSTKVYRSRIRYSVCRTRPERLCSRKGHGTCRIPPWRRSDKQEGSWCTMV